MSNAPARRIRNIPYSQKLAVQSLYSSTPRETWHAHLQKLHDELDDPKVEVLHGVEFDEINGEHHIAILNLENVSLTGTLPKTFFGLKKAISISLRENKLDGELPSGRFSAFRSLVNLDLSGNYFEGVIPGDLKSLPVLEHLNLSRNAFSGRIPKELSLMSTLQSLRLDNNALKGAIPHEMFAGGLSGLRVFFNIS